ncbi:MAG: N-acetyltransferase family protein [Clostridiaceae bacterium]
MEYEIVEFKPCDWNQIAEIYLEGINTGKATFQNTVPTWEEWDNNHVHCCRLAAKSGNQILGWAAISPTSSR